MESDVIQAESTGDVVRNREAECRFDRNMALALPVTNLGRGVAPRSHGQGRSLFCVLRRPSS